jgi:hypothetical protein
MTKSLMKSNRSGKGQPLNPSQGFGGFFPRGARSANFPRADGSYSAREVAQKTN